MSCATQNVNCSFFGVFFFFFYSAIDSVCKTRLIFLSLFLSFMPIDWGSVSAFIYNKSFFFTWNSNEIGMRLSTQFNHRWKNGSYKKENVWNTKSSNSSRETKKNTFNRCICLIFWVQNENSKQKIRIFVQNSSNFQLNVNSSNRIIHNLVESFDHTFVSIKIFRVQSSWNGKKKPNWIIELRLQEVLFEQSIAPTYIFLMERGDDLFSIAIAFSSIRYYQLLNCTFWFRFFIVVIRFSCGI